MFRKITTWVLVASAACNALAFPTASSRRERSVAPELIARQLACPPGIECGPGPVCAPPFCDLEACAGAELCQDSQDQKRSTAGPLADRQLPCPSGLDCGPGPVCTAATCDLPGCADAEVCQDGEYEKRSADTDFVHPVCDICIVGANGVPVCGCATSGVGPERRDTEKVCPLFCIDTDEGELCGCAAEDYENGNPPKA